MKNYRLVLAIVLLMALQINAVEFSVNDNTLTQDGNNGRKGLVISALSNKFQSDPGNDNNSTKEVEENQGTISGYITDMDSGMPVMGAYVKWGNHTVKSDDHGYYMIMSEEGISNLAFSHEDYYYYFMENVEIKAKLDMIYDVEMKGLYYSPNDLTYTMVEGKVVLKWNMPMGKEPMHYFVYRDMMLEEKVEDQIFLDADLMPGKYEYYVTAVYDYFESEPSNKITVMIYGDNEGKEKSVSIVESEGNYPNPFNPTTSIKFSLNEAQHVQLDIFNIRGQKVKTLLNENLSPRDYSITWNGDDKNGNQVPSGFYMYRIKTPQFSEMRRMNLIK